MKQTALSKKICIVIVSSLIMGNLFSQTIPQYLPANGLVAWYPFNGNANDESGNGNNGILNGATPTSDRNGNTGSAYSFTGTSGYISGNCSAFPIADRTVSIWFYGTNIGAGTKGKSLFGYGGSVCGTSWLEMFDLPEHPGTYEASGHCDSNLVTHSFGLDTPNNMWHHWVITNNASGIKFYLDGQLVSSNANHSDNTFVSGKEFVIGGIPSPEGTGFWIDENQEPLEGKIDDIAIYNRTLTACEITQLYTGSISNSDCFKKLPSGLPSDGLVAWYPLTGNANDSSGNANANENNGTIHGGTIFVTDRFGNANSACNFNGTTTDFIGGSCKNFPKTTRTISLWFYGASIDDASPPGKGVFGYGGSPCGTSWLQVVSPNTYAIGMHCNNNRSNYNGSVVDNNLWHHWLVTNDGVSKTKFYIDGKLLFDTTNYYNNTNTSNTEFTIGGVPSTDGLGSFRDENVGAFPGKIDDIAVYDRVLNACEIQQLYSGYKITITLQPSNVNGGNGSNAQFIVATNDAAAKYQWQTDSAGTGFKNITDGGQYIGTSNDTLLVNTVTPGNNNQLFRCIVSSPGFCSDTSSVAALSVRAQYMFIGSGNWDEPTNWVDNAIPPSPLPANSEIVINPTGTSECILNVAQTILPGGKITVMAGKKFRIVEDLRIE